MYYLSEIKELLRMSSSKVSPQKRRPPRKKSAVSKKKAQQRKINKYIRITGRVAFIIQALLSLIMIVTIGRTGMLPWKYIVLSFLGELVVFCEASDIALALP